MKSKLQLQTSAGILFLIISLGAAPAQNGPNPPHPVAPIPAVAATIDPATGLTVAQPQPEPQWIDPNWPDPNIVLTNVNYDNLPLSEVARDLRERFKNYFDILPMPKTFDVDWGDQTPIQLQMKNVNASDVFNAMNLVFENDRTPLRWELKMTRNRPLAQLRVLPEATPQPELPAPKPAETHRMVFFVGNLLGDEKSGGMTVDQIVKTVNDVWPADFGKPEDIIRFHQDAQLIVVNGTREQIDFIQQTLAALRQKVNAAHGPYGGGRSQFPRGLGGVGSGGFGQLRNDQNTNNLGDQ